jgi:hypothetical protein
MAQPRRYLNRLNDWEQVDAAVAANAAELPHLEVPRAKLKGLLEQARSLTVQQSTLTASKQATSKELRKVIRQGEALVDFLRTGVREHFGTTSEKLVEFGVQPFRGRPRATVSQPPETPKPQTPEAPSSTPTPDTTK